MRMNKNCRVCDEKASWFIICIGEKNENYFKYINGILFRLKLKKSC